MRCWRCAMTRPNGRKNRNHRIPTSTRKFALCQAKAVTSRCRLARMLSITTLLLSSLSLSGLRSASRCSDRQEHERKHGEDDRLDQAHEQFEHEEWEEDNWRDRQDRADQHMASEDASKQTEGERQRANEHLEPAQRVGDDKPLQVLHQSKRPHFEHLD